MRTTFALCLLVTFVASCASRHEHPDRSPGPIHVTVFKERGRYAGWPANHGIWSWGDEILVGFEIGYHKGTQPAVNPLSQTKDTHAIDYTRPAEHVLARSLDGGETWAIERPSELIPPEGEKVARVPTGKGGRQPVDCPGGIDFTHPDFAMTLRMLSYHVGPSRFLYTLDRGRSWRGPFQLPNFDTPGIAARTDYLVEGKHEMLAFLTAAKSNRKQGRVICVRTQDGGASWQVHGRIGPEPGPGDKANMPSSVRQGPASLLTARRRVDGIDLYRSDDNGKSWRYLNHPVRTTGSNGNPPDLLRLDDGRLALIYGFRAPPYGVRVQFSSDDGNTWSDSFHLRDDGGYWDVGYPRSVQRPDGKVVTVYYFTEGKESERHILATIWDPSQLICEGQDGVLKQPLTAR